MLAFELLEGLRGLQQMRPGGLAIVNRQRITPASVTYGTAEYPANAEEEIRQACPRALIVDALRMAEDLGNPRAVNSVLMGVLAHHCEIPLACWEDALRQMVKPRFVELNLTAFRQGAELGSAPVVSEKQYHWFNNFKILVNQELPHGYHHRINDHL